MARNHSGLVAVGTKPGLEHRTLPGTGEGPQNRTATSGPENMRNLFCPGRFILSLFLGYLAVGGARPCLGALTNVNIIDFAFAPSKVKINVNDQVKWTWTGASAHSTTSDGALWDSDVHGTGFTFTNTFTT